MATLLDQLAALQELEARAENLAQRQERFSRRELDLVLGLARELNTCTSPGEALHFLLHQAIRLAGAQRGAIVELDEQGGLRFTLGADRDGFPLHRPETQVSHSIIHMVLESGQPLRSSNLGQLEELSQARSVIDLDLKSSLCAPLRRHGKVFGALYVDSSSTTLYSEHMLVLLDGFCELCSLTLTQLQLRRSEQAQQRRYDHFEQLHLSIVDSLPNALALYDARHRLCFTNLTFRRELGQLSIVRPDPEAPLGWAFEEAFSRFLDSLAEHPERTGGADWAVDGRRLRCRPFSPPTDEGSLAVRGVVLSDVTTELRMQQELLESEKFAMVSRTAGSIAHEIRNALAPLHGHVQLARITLQDRPSVCDDLDPDLQVVEEMAGRIERIVRTLSDLSRPPKRQLAELDLNALAAGVVTLLKDMGGKIKRFDLSVGGPEPDLEDRGGLRVRLDAQPRLPKLLGDGEQLQQMLLNLVINAAHAVESVGGGWVQVRTRAVGDQLLLVVEDNGCGMSEEVLARVWEPYYTTKGESGSGLGMPLVRQVVEAHQGLIQVQSVAGEGTTFRLLFPGVKAGA